MTTAAGTHVPQIDLKRQAADLAEELRSAIDRVVRSGNYILGEEVEAFEREIAAYLGIDATVGVASGTDALWLALRAAGIGPGDGVVLPAFTFFATASATVNAGAEPVLVDVDPTTFNLDLGQLADVLAARSPLHRRRGLAVGAVKAVIPVHLYGHPVDMDRLTALAREHRVQVIEDAAQAMGARIGDRAAGTLGEYGCFSFFPTKTLGALGDGGLVVARDDVRTEGLRRLRMHGSRTKYRHDLLGTNSRLDALQAAVLRVKLTRLEDWIARRAEHARAYDAGLSGLSGIAVPAVAPGVRHAWHQYTLRVADGRRDLLHDFLLERGVASTVYYPTPLHLQPALASLAHAAGDFPVAERAAAEVLSLPMFPEMTPEQRDRVIAGVREFCAGTG